MATTFVNGDFRERTLDLIEIQTTLAVKSDGSASVIFLLGYDDETGLKTTADGYLQLWVSPQQADRIAQQVGAPTWQVLANALRNSFEDSTISFRQQYCEEGQPILQLNADGELEEVGGEYTQTWWKMDKLSLRVDISDAANAYINELNIELDKEAVRDARKAQAELQEKSRRVSNDKRKAYAAKQAKKEEGVEVFETPETETPIETPKETPVKTGSKGRTK